MILAPRHELLSRAELVLNPRGFREHTARELRLPVLARLAWAHERRTVHAIRFRTRDGRTFAVANVHCTSYAADRRIADAELARAAAFARSLATAGDVIVLAGDFNVTREESGTLPKLVSDGFSRPGPGIDHVLVRGAAAGEPRRLPDGWRRRGDLLLSDHAPVQVAIG
jgi:endonuclease/exonuclease/phosphatase family metal-dependent hydrolase